ncbi:hypothetical protein ACQ4LE_004582 [Meloidogyne hapla]|uniref:NUC153 domain-containing protein n=1 Tax=Meloidogyne hapla TaxID=6305 RepID=A0A1I8AYF0_MELHA
MSTTDLWIKRKHLKKSRPKSKAEKLIERQQWLMSFNHTNFDNQQIQPDEDDENTVKRINKKLKRKSAKVEMEELFKDLDAEEFEDEEELADCSEQNNEDFGADNEGDDNLAIQSFDHDVEHDGHDSSDNLEESNCDNEGLDSDDDAPPEEFSSNLHEDTNVHKQISETNLQNEHQQHRKKISKKKRDAIKQKMEVDNGVFRVQKGATQFGTKDCVFEIVSLDKSDATDEEDEGSLMCSTSLIPLDGPKINNKKRKVLAPPNLGFREQLLRISTANKRKKRRSN